MYELLKAQLGRQLGRKPLAHEAAVCGSISGGIAAAATTPLDVLKTRVMLDMRVRILAVGKSSLLTFFPLQDASKGSMPSLLTRFKQIYHVEGVSALFSGVVPRTMWISAGGAVFLGVYEWVIQSMTSR